MLRGHRQLQRGPARHRGGDEDGRGEGRPQGHLQDQDVRRAKLDARQHRQARQERHRPDPEPARRGRK